LDDLDILPQGLEDTSDLEILLRFNCFLYGSMHYIEHSNHTVHGRPELMGKAASVRLERVSSSDKHVANLCDGGHV
jgi:hypothetical protein